MEYDIISDIETLWHYVPDSYWNLVGKYFLNRKPWRGEGRHRHDYAGRGIGRVWGRRGDRDRGRSRTTLSAGQHECSSCHLRTECVKGVSENHDHHFPRCSKYVRSWYIVGSVRYYRRRQRGGKVVHTHTNSQRIHTQALTYTYTRTK